MFLTETDTKVVKTSSNYQIRGYETFLPKLEENEPVRILALVSNKLMRVNPTMDPDNYSCIKKTKEEGGGCDFILKM